MNFIFCKLNKPQKTWISFFASLKILKKTWISVFASLKNVKKHEFRTRKNLNNWNLVMRFSVTHTFCHETQFLKLTLAKNHWLYWKHFHISIQLDRPFYFPVMLILSVWFLCQGHCIEVDSEDSHHVYFSTSIASNTNKYRCTQVWRR